MFASDADESPASEDCRIPNLRISRDSHASLSAFASFALLLIGAESVGCAMRVTPPSDVREPATVFVADYLNHASLILPRDDGTLVEYAYGEWEWFARNRDGAIDVLRVLTLPSGGTLGRRPIEPLTDALSIQTRLGLEAASAVTVDRSRATQVLAELDSRFESHRSTELYNPVVQLSFVRDERVYWAGHNCNSAVAEWLEQLGCEVSGCRLLAQFDCVGDARRSTSNAQ